MRGTRRVTLGTWLLGACAIAWACSLQAPSEDELFSDDDASAGNGGSAGSGGGNGGTSGTNDASDDQSNAGSSGSSGNAGNSGSGGAGGGGGDGGPNDSGVHDSTSDAPFNPMSGLVLYYPFDETSGTVVHDQLDSRKNGTVYGTPTWVTAGKIAGALQFSGVTADEQYVQLPRDILLQFSETTIACWYRWDGGKSWQRLFDLGSGQPSWIYFSPLTDVGARVAVHEPETNTFFDIIVTNPPGVGTWAHVAVTWSEASVDVYINGARVAGKVTPMILPSDLGNTVQNWIGRSQFAVDPFYAGIVDDFRIYDHKLSAEDVAALYELH